MSTADHSATQIQPCTGHEPPWYAVAPACTSQYDGSAAHVGLGGAGWSTEGWIVLAAWAIGATILARRAYVRDTKKA